METPSPDFLSTELTEKLARARDDLLARMNALGLTPKDGWRIAEEVRSTMSGTMIVLRPVHMRLKEPAIESAVEIGRDGRAIE
jgi:hypothetical protein